MYNKEGEHVMSCLPCLDSCRDELVYDLCEPSGEVITCNNSEWFFNQLGRLFGFQELIYDDEGNVVK